MSEVGHWASLTEMEKFTQATRISGVIEQDVKRGGLFYGTPAPMTTAAVEGFPSSHPTLPLSQWTGKRMEWLREDDVSEAEDVDIGAQLEWTDDDTVTECNAKLYKIYKQTKLDYIEEVYGTINNYRQIQLIRNVKGCVKKLEKNIIYGDHGNSTYAGFSTIQMDGLHALVGKKNATAGTANGVTDIDEGSGALSLANMRTLVRTMLYGIHLWLIPMAVGDYFDAMMQESAIKAGYQWTRNEFGQRMDFFSQVPMARSDYLVAETADTGRGSNKRTKNTTGSSENFSIFALNFGQLAMGEPGVSLGFGGQNRSVGQIFKVVGWEDLQDYDASGQRVIGYCGMGEGSIYGVGRIHDITLGAITA